MDSMRTLDALCPTCDEVQKHTMQDAGSCACISCGNIQQLVSPLA